MHTHAHPVQNSAPLCRSFTLHDKHSSSHLMSKVIQDTDKLYTSQRMCADSLHTRNRSAVTEMEHRKKHRGGFEDMHGKIDESAGMQFYRIRNLEILKNMLRVYSAASPGQDGRPVVSNIDGHVNCAAGRREMSGDTEGYGGMHPLSPEFIFNAKRGQSLAAGLVDDEGRAMDVSESQLDPSSYFSSDGSFTLPTHESGSPHMFYISTSLNKRTIFDCSLPRSSGGSVQPGDHLMSLFVQTHLRLEKATGFTVTEYARFREVAKVDATAQEEEWHLKSQLHAYDLMGDIGLSNCDVTSSGEEKYVISVKSACEVAQEDAVRIFERVVKPWQEQQNTQLRLEEDRFLSAHPQADENHPSMLEMHDRKKAFHARYYDVKQDWAMYHLRCLEHCFVSSRDRETNPGGFNSMYDSLQKLVAENDGYACYTDSEKMSVQRRYTAKDKSTWAHMQDFLAHIFQDDCRMDGRDERIAHEVYLTSFEMFTPLTFILVLSSEPGRGKSIFSSRFASVMPTGMCTESSSSSKKAGMNGNISAQDGRVCFSDELPEYLTPADPSEQIERIKCAASPHAVEVASPYFPFHHVRRQVCGESRSYTSERTMEVAGTNGAKSHKTVTIKSPDRRVVRTALA